MSVESVFLGWDAPFLARVADVLLARSTTGGESDLSTNLIVVPGGRAGRRLLELLVDGAMRLGTVLIPPTVVTMGALPEQLYRPARPLASETASRLAWLVALRETPTAVRAEFLPHAPDLADHRAWLALADHLRAMHAELAGECLDFDDVATRGEQLERFNEGPRWRALGQARARYVDVLERAGLCDVHEERRRVLAAGNARCDVAITLVGVSDAPRVVRAMLDGDGMRATAYVFAPQELGDRFEVDGTLRPSAWTDVAIAFDERNLRFVDRPGDQANAAADQVSSWIASAPAEDIVVGVSDAVLAVEVETRLAARGVTARSARGRSVDETPPATLLRALGESVTHRSFQSIAAIVRHPDAHELFAGCIDDNDRSLASGAASLLDRHVSKHLPPEFARPWPDAAKGHAAALDRIAGAWQTFCGELLDKPRPVALWSAAIADALARAYETRTFRREDAIDGTWVEAFDAVRVVLEELAALPGAIAPELTAPEAIELALESLRSHRVSPRPAPDAVEVLGWLELPLDDAPHLVVCDLNEGTVPESLNADPFLPNNLRKHLGLLDNDRRFARDAFALSAMLASRPNVTLVSGRRDASGDPLAPSRLLLAAEPEVVARRVLSFYAERAEPPIPAGSATPAVAVSSRLPVPMPTRSWLPTRPLRVTAFRDYLACPYRFYLRHLERLETVDDAADEIDAAQFGTIAHDVLEAFGLDASVRDETDSARIRDYLRAEMERQAHRRFGDRRRPVAHVQLAQLASRLDAFASWQAQHAREGWRIVAVESEIDSSACGIETPAGRLGLSGRVDRIDERASTRERVVYDYKTATHVEKPDRAHRRSGRWVDLQLPLYLHALPGLGFERVTRAGYIALPARTDETRDHVANWSETDLEDAMRAARSVAEGVLTSVFWPPSEAPELRFEAFDAICQRGQLSAAADAETDA